MPADTDTIIIPPGGKRLRDIEREATIITLEQNEYNRTDTAKSLDISRPKLLRMMRAYNIIPPPKPLSKTTESP